jgi:hypothetical protein
MNGNWAERDERLVKLPEDDPKIFAAYINVVYTNIPTSPTEKPMDMRAIDNEYTVLSKLYVLSEKFCDVAAKNATIEAILAVKDEKATDGNDYLPGWLSIRTMYEGTPKGAPGRRLIVNLWTNFGFKEDFMERNEVQLPRDFIFDLMLALGKERQAQASTLQSAMVRVCTWRQ